MVDFSPAELREIQRAFGVEPDPWGPLLSVLRAGLGGEPEPDPWAFSAAELAQLQAVLLAGLGGPSPAPGEVYLYGEVGWDITAEAFIASLPAGDLNLRVNSPGGNAFEAMSIYSHLSSRPGRVRVTVDGLCASAATVIAMAADRGELVTSAGSVWMVHEAWIETAATAGELRKQADILDIMNQVIAGTYSSRTGLPVAHWLDLMAKETWFSGPESVTALLADRIGAVRSQEADTAPVAARYRQRAGVFASADPGRPQGVDQWGHPVSAATKRAAFAMYERLKREHEAQFRGARNGRVAAAAPGEHSAFAKAVYGVD